MNSGFSGDILRSILELLPPPDLARAACVCRLWRFLASDRELLELAFRKPWNVKRVMGTPSSAAFWRSPGLDRFAISHRLQRGDSVAGLALKYSVQHYGAVRGAGNCIASCPAIFDASSSPPRMTFVRPFGHSGTTSRFYSVESLDGDLLQIWRHDSWVKPDEAYDGELSAPGPVYETQNFTMFKLDRKLFLGDNRSMLLKTRDLPGLKENCIYFTEGETEQYLGHRRII